jgi:hypothetical protein
MDPLSATVAILAILCGTGVLSMPFFLVRMVMDRKLKITEMQARANEAAVREGLIPIREEVEAFRRETNDVVLSFDTTLHRLEARLQRLEQQVLAASPQETAPPLPAGEKRSWVESHVPGEQQQSVGVRRPPR